MHDLVLKSGWDTIVFGVPFIGLLLVGLFRLDELIVAPKHKTRAHRPPAGVDTDGMQILCDPDGTPWRRPGRRK